jgi:hypothetical protein
MPRIRYSLMVVIFVSSSAIQAALEPATVTGVVETRLEQSGTFEHRVRGIETADGFTTLALRLGTFDGSEFEPLVGHSASCSGFRVDGDPSFLLVDRVDACTRERADRQPMASSACKPEGASCQSDSACCSGFCDIWGSLGYCH